MGMWYMVYFLRGKRSVASALATFPSWFQKQMLICLSMCLVMLNFQSAPGICFAGLMVTMVCLLSFFQQVQFRVFRASLFAALGMWGVVPAGHILITSWGKPAVMNAVSHAMVMGLIYIVSSRLTIIVAP